MGIVRNYVLHRCDRPGPAVCVAARLLQPMGWTPSRLPAGGTPRSSEEIRSPGDWTDATNRQKMRAQLQRLGLSIDWDGRWPPATPTITAGPSWLFHQFHEAGLAYAKEATGQLGPIDKTVLANEQGGLARAAPGAPAPSVGETAAAPMVPRNHDYGPRLCSMTPRPARWRPRAGCARLQGN